MTFKRNGVKMRMVHTPPCIVCQKVSHIAMPDDAYGRWAIAGQMIQDAWPEGSTDEREMILNGTHPDCWGHLMKIQCEYCEWRGREEFYDAHLDL